MASAEKRAEEKRLLASNPKTAHLVPWLDVEEAAEVMGFTPMHIKQLIRGKRLRATKVGFPGYPKWLVDPESAKNYTPRSATPTGMRRMVLRYDPDRFDLEALKNYLSTKYPGGSDGETPIYTLRRPKTSKSKKKAQAEPKDFTPEILETYSASNPPKAVSRTSKAGQRPKDTS